MRSILPTLSLAWKRVDGCRMPCECGQVTLAIARGAAKSSLFERRACQRSVVDVSVCRDVLRSFGGHGQPHCLRRLRLAVRRHRPVLDFDAAPSTHSIERLVAFVEKKRLEVEWILQTHAYAGHLSGASVLNGRVGGKTGIGRSIVDVRSMLSATLDLSSEPGFDHLFAPDEVFFIGTLQAQVLAMPEPTPFDAAFMIEDALFVVDTLFMPEVGAWRRVCVRGPASLAGHACRFPSNGTRTCLGRQDR
ncbi:hypothetical protein [Paraburkholderia youngii]|uniref:hypothetical protein n=1 Tax=Paraburkholderia youngii TaxID=2782701 RepID=UPI003D1BD4D5